MFQGMIDEMYETFTGSVAEYRGLKQQAVIDTQAGLYLALALCLPAWRMKSLTLRRRSMLSRQSISNPVKNLHSDAGSRDGPANQNVTRRKHKPRHLKQPAGCFLCLKREK